MGYGGSGNEGGGFRLSGRVLMALLVAAISLISYFGTRSQNPVTHQVQHVGISTDQEIALGLHAVPQMEDQYGGLSQDQDARRRVERIGRRLVAQTVAHESPYEFQFHLLADDKTINAFALPGGQVFMTAGLLKRLSTEGQVAGVLGHEIGHVIERHGAQHLAKEQLTQGLSGAAVIASYDPNNPRSQQTAAVALAIGKLVNLRFSRNDELQADQWGVRLTAEAGYDPRSMITVMEILNEASHGGGPPEFFSTHPNPEHRIERIRAAIAQQFPGGVPQGLEE